MSLLNQIYKFSEPTTATMKSSLYFPLQAPVKKLNSIEFDFFNEEVDISALWNFGDPFSNNNEFVSGSVLDIVPHTYKYAGNYEINCVANIDGTVKHITANLIIVPDTGDRIISSKPEGIYTVFVYNNFQFNIDLYCYDHTATIYYTIGASSTDYIKYEDTLTFSEDFVIKYYATFLNGYSTETFTKTFQLNKNQYSLQINPIQSTQVGTFNMSLFTVPSIASNPDFEIYYTTSQNSTPKLYTGSVAITESTTITAWIVHTYEGTPYVYDPIIKPYII